MTIDEIISKLLHQRGLKSKEEIEEFLHPTHPEKLTPPFQTNEAKKIVLHHVKNNSPIAIYGDYDVDGICSTAILWETLHPQNNLTFPFIPQRHKDGYGLSISGIDECLTKGAKLIISVDSGIVAHKAVEYCRLKGVDIIIVDHHEPLDTLPNANAILHSTSTCAAVLSWFFSKDIGNESLNDHLSLAAMAVICDMIPLVNLNRSFAYFGLEQLRKTKRPGLLNLLQLAGVNPQNLSSYHVGFIIGPRLNATGRLEHALESLRLICTKSNSSGLQLALKLTELNKSRQDQTAASVNHALSLIDSTNPSHLLVSFSESYNEGVIGLVASKLVEKFYRPAVVISVSDSMCKGSARSLPGIHMTDKLRQLSDLLTSVGGHSMAAGISFETKNLDRVVALLKSMQFDESLFIKTQRVDLRIEPSFITRELFEKIQTLEPFGLGNPSPIFSSLFPAVSQIKKIGSNQQHLKFSEANLDAVWFNLTAEGLSNLFSEHELIYQVTLNNFNGRESIQLLVKDSIKTV